ncbi:glycosyltransferase [Candidatus Thiothrix sp. Deng01]|uniref:Glycosyltransferase n=1 Tax=Candidatus Thiothrix phosphatis TaxID=3112415 RepID=A0ABU6D3T9_9GAMM|nr:glycosyltransferase [Candidatus Thiothrix sp. Deng01]MEB4593348.1 glycosyltransferase [Candidatus Thiothrix sp. Deng01]
MSTIYNKMLSTKDKPILSIIIPAYNEEAYIAPTLAAAFAATRRYEGESEIIVVDNNSTDQTRAIATASGAKVIFEAKNQIARARNAGAQAARGQCLVFVDADTLLEGDILDKVATNMADGKVIGGGAWTEPDLAGGSAWLFKYGVNMLLALGNVTVGPFLYCDREAFLRVGGFDETLYAAEEFSLARRLKEEARKQQKQWRIIKFHPGHRIITSSRKFGRFGGLGMALSNAHLLWNTQRKLRNKDECGFWYAQRKPK